MRQAFEQETGTRLLLGLRVGPAIWGFPGLQSPQPDQLYGIFVRPTAAYLRLRPLPELSLNREILNLQEALELEAAWIDLPEFLRQLVENHSQALGVVFSPEAIWDEPPEAHPLQPRLQKLANSAAALRPMAHEFAERGALLFQRSQQQPPDLPTAFDTLRTILQAHWVIQQQSIPPLAFQELLNRQQLPMSIRQWVKTELEPRSLQAATAETPLPQQVWEPLAEELGQLLRFCLIKANKLPGGDAAWDEAEAFYRNILGLG